MFLQAIGCFSVGLEAAFRRGLVKAESSAAQPAPTASTEAMFSPLLLTALPLLSIQGDDHDKWIPILTTSSGPDHPSVDLVENLSDDTKTVIDVQIPGFFTSAIEGGDGGKYAGVSVDGWQVNSLEDNTLDARVEELGAPELPVIRLSLVVPPGCDSARLDTVNSDLGTTTRFTLGDLAPDPSSPPVPLYPVHESEWDGDPDAGIPNGIAPAFAGIKQDYGPSGCFPETHFDSIIDAQPGLAGLNTVELEIRPFRWNETQQQLEVIPEFQLCYLHPSGNPSAGDEHEIEYDVAAGAFAGMFNGSQMNWSTGPQYQGRYLIYTSKDYLGELLPFIQHRQLTGYDVDVRFVENLADPSTDGIRASIQNWYAGGSPSTDHFCLLVGTTQDFPLIPAPTDKGTLGDDMYGSPVDGDLAEEIYVGRIALSFFEDASSQLTHQLNKIMEYENHVAVNYDFNRILMASHEEAAPGKYTGLVLDVAQELNDFDADIDTPLALGNLAASSDAYVVNQIDQEVGYVMYRGHGSTTSWSDWNTAGQDFNATDVGSLSNNQLPIYWSLSCSNGRNQNSGSNARAWMDADRGAVAAYAAQGVTKTLANHESARWLARLALQNDGVPHGIVIAFAEALMEAQFAGEYDESNAWHYSLLGCPAMPCRTDSHAIQFALKKKPKEILVVGTKLIDADSSDGSLELLLEETATSGSLLGTRATWVAGEAGLRSDGELVQAVSENQQINDKSQKSLGFNSSLTIEDVEGNLPTDLTFAMRWPNGQLETFEVPMTWGSFKNLLGGVADNLGNQPYLAADDVLAEGQAFDLEIWNAEPLSIGALFLALDSLPIPLENAGVFHAFPIYQSSTFGTDLQGRAVIGQGPLPTGLPAGLELTYQAVVLDPDTVDSLTLTNGLVGAL